jgi:hypothetical protein
MSRSGLARLLGGNVVSWDVRRRATGEADAARIVEFVRPRRRVSTSTLLDRIEDGSRVRTICAWAERGGVVGASAVAAAPAPRCRTLARVDRGRSSAISRQPGRARCDGDRLQGGSPLVRVKRLRGRDADGGLGAALGVGVPCPTTTTT